ncbi:MAG TPA: C40 family peptidase [Gammaproteobacteria bacterium]
MTVYRRLAALALLILLLAGCATRPVEIPEDAGTGGRKTVVDTAQRMLGAPYRPGGASPRGFDCSGLVRYSFGHAGIEVPRTAAEQFARARPVGRRPLQPGDLVFFKTAGRKISHVGIYVGQRRFVHAPSGGKHVSVDSLDDPYWRRRMAGAGHYFN